MAKLTGPNKTELERRIVGLYKFILRRMDYKTRVSKFEVLSNWNNGAYKIRFTSLTLSSVQLHFDTLVDFYEQHMQKEKAEVKEVV